MAYGDFKDLTRRTISDKILPDEAFSFSKNLKYVRYQCGLSLMVYKLFDKKVAVILLAVIVILKMRISQAKN